MRKTKIAQIKKATKITTFGTYKRILIKDSTCFQLPASLQDKYPGSGGKDSGAAIRIQFEYDLLSGNIIQLRIDPFNHQDAANATESIALIQPGDLVIRDLGYMHKKVLEIIDHQRAASYVARLDPRINAYEKKANGAFKRIDFVKLRAQMKRENTPIIEKTVYLGAEKSHCTRLIVTLLPKKIEQQRLRKVIRARKRNGSKEPSRETKIRSQLTLMITNEHISVLAASHVYRVYMLRWQIELIFKTWKSMCGLASIKMVKPERIECYIIGKLILMFISWYIIWPSIGQAYRCYKKVISYYKATRTVLNHTGKLATAIIHKNCSLKEILRKIYKTFTRQNLLETKGKDQEHYAIIKTYIANNKMNRLQPLA